MTSAIKEQEGFSSPDFGATYTVEPYDQHLHQHTHTVIFLHGRGSTGEEFASELLSSQLSSGNTLRNHFPAYRWVFPSSPTSWSTVFQEDMPSWFEAASLTDTPAQQELQIRQIRNSVAHVEQIIEREVAQLNGDAERLVLGGISQGGAIALWTLLRATFKRRLLPTRFVGTSTWLPLAEEVLHILSGKLMEDSTVQGNKSHAFVKDMLELSKEDSQTSEESSSAPLVRVFLGHGRDDAYVDAALGQQAKDILERITQLRVQWREYEGAEQEGHWFKIPQEIDDIATFLTA